MHVPRGLFATWLGPPSLYIPSNSSRINVWLAAMLPVVCLLPFLNKALNIDDPMFVWSAQQLIKDPVDFYGFQINWYGYSLDRADLINQNPPGVAYYLVIVGSLFGWSESVLHAAMLLPAAVVGWGCYRLAQCFCRYPLTATLINIFTPVFLVSASTLMSDVLMLAFYVWAVIWWIRGLESGRWWYLAVAGSLVVLATLTKYFGASLFALLGTYAWCYERRLGKWLFYLVVALIPIMAFELYVRHLYGHGLINDAFNYPTHYRILGLSQIFTGILFLGGCFISPVFYFMRLWPPRITWIFGLIFLVGVPLLSWMVSSNWLETSLFFAHLLIFMVAGIQILALAFLEVRHRSDAVTWLLLLWVLGVFLFAVFLNWTVSGRSLLPMLPAIGILVIRYLDRQEVTLTTEWRRITPLVSAGILAMLILAQDVVWANSIRTASQCLMKEYSGTLSGGMVWFQGAWGFQYYMEQQGARKMQYDHLTIHVGDLIVVPLNSNNFSIPNQSNIQKIAELNIPVSRWASTMDFRKNAGFYSSLFGSFPYFFGAAENTYLIYRANP